MTHQNIHFLPVITASNHTQIIVDDLSNTLIGKTFSAIDALSSASDALNIPLYSSKVEAGFASPADDFVEEYLDLNKLLVKHHEATFFVRVSGKSMIDAGIFPDDILIVDRSIIATDGKVVIANVDGDVTVKRLSLRNGQVKLKSENSEYKSIAVTGDLHIWGVVTSVIHQV